MEIAQVHINLCSCWNKQLRRQKSKWKRCWNWNLTSGAFHSNLKRYPLQLKVYGHMCNCLSNVINVYHCQVKTSTILSEVLLRSLWDKELFSKQTKSALIHPPSISPQAWLNEVPRWDASASSADTIRSYKYTFSKLEFATFWNQLLFLNICSWRVRTEKVWNNSSWTVAVKFWYLRRNEAKLRVPRSPQKNLTSSENKLESHVYLQRLGVNDTISLSISPEKLQGNTKLIIHKRYYPFIEFLDKSTYFHATPVFDRISQFPGLDLCCEPKWFCELYQLDFISSDAKMSDFKLQNATLTSVEKPQKYGSENLAVKIVIFHAAWSPQNWNLLHSNSDETAMVARDRALSTVFRNTHGASYHGFSW